MMFVSKRSLPRRTFLRGAGAALALPLLDAMVPSLTAVVRTAAAPQRRMGFVYIPHGAEEKFWVPKTAGKDFEFSRILKPMEDVRDYVTVITNIRNKAGVRAVVNPGFGQGPAIVTRNYRQLGISLPLYQSHGVASKQFIDLAGPAAENVRLPAAALLVANKLPDTDAQKPVVVNYARTYQQKTGQAVSNVDCPNDVDVKKGGTFTCDLKLQNGKTGTITITQLDDKGHVRWQVTKVS